MGVFQCKILIVTTIAMALAASSGWADQASLYDEAPPSDAVFVRVLAEYGAPVSPITFAGATLPVNTGETDMYIAISAAELSGVTAGSYYSLASDDAGPMMIEEPIREITSKVQLILLNTGLEDVRLIVPGKGTEVVAPLKPGKAASRAVNPIVVDLAVERVSDGAVLGNFNLSLSRGQNLTFVATDRSARMIENIFGRVLALN